MISAAGQQLITSIVGIIASGVIGFLVAKVTHLSKFAKARVEIEKAMARQMIFDAYEDYVVKGKKLTIARYDELLRIFDAYTALGGNGTAKQYMEAIKALKPYLVVD